MVTFTGSFVNRVLRIVAGIIIFWFGTKWMSQVWAESIDFSPTIGSFMFVSGILILAVTLLVCDLVMFDGQLVVRQLFSRFLKRR